MIEFTAPGWWRRRCSPGGCSCRIVSKRLGSTYRSGRVNAWLKIKNPVAPAVKRQAEEDWGEEQKCSEHRLWSRSSR
jgi:hypothetical protein